MRATIKNYIEAANRRREEEGEEGFSLIELIIVIVIIGILAAIAIPIFANIQQNANDAAGQSAAANGASTAAVAASKTGSTTVAGDTYPELIEGSVTNVVLTKYDKTVGLASICVTATITGGSVTTWTGGPAASADHKTCS